MIISKLCLLSPLYSCIYLSIILNFVISFWFFNCFKSVYVVASVPEKTIVSSFAAVFYFSFFYLFSNFWFSFIGVAFSDLCLQFLLSLQNAYVTHVSYVVALSFSVPHGCFSTLLVFFGPFPPFNILVLFSIKVLWLFCSLICDFFCVSLSNLWLL